MRVRVFFVATQQEVLLAAPSVEEVFGDGLHCHVLRNCRSLQCVGSISEVVGYYNGYEARKKSQQCETTDQHDLGVAAPSV
jgi:hypothetical protein